jgi:hypothetical protein
VRNGREGRGRGVYHLSFTFFLAFLANGMAVVAYDTPFDICS